jgi:hypothetical protein
MKDIDISKIFGSKCRTKILEKFFLEYESGYNDWFYMRALSRDLNEQINSVKRELDSLADLWILKYKVELKKKIFYINPKLTLIPEFVNIFLKSYNPIDKIKDFFKNKTDLELIIVNENIKSKLTHPWKSILDIFLIWEINKEEFSDFLSQIFYGRKVKYAIIPTEDFYRRLDFWDKLVKDILSEEGNVFLKDNLRIKEKFGIS